MKKWFFAALLGCGVVQADMLEALKAYENKNYSEAQQHFAELLPLGNELAAFNLGVMAYQGDGQPQNLQQALAYFMLAAQLQHQQSEKLIKQLSANATEQQKEQARLLFERLKNNVLITPTNLSQNTDQHDAEPIKRVEPKFPIDAARKSLFGYVAVRFLVDENGKVSAVDTMDAFPERTFEKATVQAVKKWRYEPTGQKHVQRVRMDYSIGGDIKIAGFDNIINKLELWPYAIAGSPSHQMVLGTVLSLAQVQGENKLEFDTDLPLLSEPDYSIYKKTTQLTPEFDHFWGQAIVKVAENGVITEQISADFAPENKLETLVGQRFKGNIIAGKYSILRLNRSYMRNYEVTPVLTVSSAMSGKFWWEQAAKNGNIEAQRIMAAYDEQWENYLLSKDDAEVMAWTGTRLILEGQRERGLQLLEQSIAKNYKPAAELKKQFML
jgi:TonB family protein